VTSSWKRLRLTDTAASQRHSAPLSRLFICLFEWIATLVVGRLSPSVSRITCSPSIV